MTRKAKAAIEVLNKYKAKFDHKQKFFEDLLILEGIEYSKRYFGPDNSFAGTFGKIMGERDFFTPQVNNLHAINAINSMISTIESVGLYKKPDKNFLSHFNNAALISTVASVVIFFSGLSFWFGGLRYDYEREKEKKELEQARDSLFHLRTLLIPLIIEEKNKEAAPSTDTSHKQSDTARIKTNKQ